MKLLEILNSYTNDYLKKLVRLVGGGSRLTRKDELVTFLAHELLSAQRLAHHWQQLDVLAQKVVASAYHNDGAFHADAFVAQYGGLPKRSDHYGWGYIYTPIALDLFLHQSQLPDDLMPVLKPLMPPVERFQIEGVAEAPGSVAGFEGEVALCYAETEQTGLHDLTMLLRLIDQGKVKLSSSSDRITPTTVNVLVANLLASDFFSLPAKPDQVETIRPFGLQVFVTSAGWVSRTRGELTAKGRAFLRSQDPELLLEAFEQWSESGPFDELTRISALRGFRSRGIRLTKPSQRRANIIEALSWCPAGVWIPLEEFYRAVKIWHFDFALEEGFEQNLYIGYGKEVVYHGWTTTEGRWLLTNGLYINAVLWEYLASIGALDLLYVEPEDADFPAEAYYHEEASYSRYDGLKYFRINPLGAYLLGQAAEYVSPQPAVETYFSIAPDLRLTLLQPSALTPSLEYQLQQITVAEGNGVYGLDTGRLLTALAEGGKFDDLTGFLAAGNRGPLPAEVMAWLEQTKHNSRAFSISAQALYVKAQSAELTQLALDDPVLRTFCHRVDSRTLVIPANREKAMRTRLQELGYGVRAR